MAPKTKIQAKPVAKKTKQPADVTPEAGKKPKKVNYLNNKDLLADVISCKEKGVMSDKLARKLQILTERYAKKGNYANYTYNDDMQAYAMMMLVKTWSSFDPAKSSNPFAFFTQCIKHSFIQYLNQEKKQRNIRDELLVDIGLSPSYTFQLEQDPERRERELDFNISSAGPSTVGINEYGG